MNFIDRVSQFANRRGLYLGRRSARIHTWLYRRTGGRLSGHLPGHPNARIALVDHIGARTGKRRTSPLIYHEQNDVVAVVASKAGQLTHPAWFHNLTANPDTTIQIGRDARAVRARVADDDERRRLWPALTAIYSGYDYFAQLAEGRTIPIVLLAPRRKHALGRGLELALHRTMREPSGSGEL